MRLGIIECGRHRPELHRRFGPYAEMFMRWLSPAAPELQFEVVDVVQGEDPGSPDRFDAWLIGGSPSAVYETDPWIRRLEGFVREAYSAEAPMIGVCFGHQMLAHALGGRVEKSDAGWGCGVHSYRLSERPSWITAPGDELRLRAMHQDQVLQAPKDATRIAGSTFCPNAALVYGDSERPKAFSLQPHPEFEAGFAAALIELRTDNGVPVEVAKPALQTLAEDQMVMNAAVAGWVAEFLRISQRGRG